MKTIEILFWSSLALAFYAYAGYGIILYLVVVFKKKISRKAIQDSSFHEMPEVTLMVCAYNEIDYVHRKVKNSFDLDYPVDKLKLVWVTDGSDDGTEKALEAYPGLTVLHQPARNGKIGAINRGMAHVKTPFVIFSDANAMLNARAVKVIMEAFRDPSTGCVSGEKRISENSEHGVAAGGEGAYWKYESFLKKLDSELYSAVGAAGELFAIRTELFEQVEKDTLLDDFIISLRIAMKGYKIKYTPDAWAAETASENVSEELKRKIRIAAGGLQSIVRLLPLLNIFRFGMLSFQYISHRVLRWSIIPVLLPVLLILSFLLKDYSVIYNILFNMQLLFYMLAAAGWLMEKYNFAVPKLLYLPYYFYIMNYAVYRGMLRLVMKKQAVNWERSKRGR